MSGVADPRKVVLQWPAALQCHCEALMRALGVSAADAQQTVDVFLQAELMGEQSHGLRLFLQVLSRLRAGGDRTATEIEVVMDRGAVALWDARRSLGQVTAARAMLRAIEKAHDHGIGYVAVRNGNSFTSAKYYPLIAAKAGMIGFAFTNTSRKLMPPPGGITPVLGNNPVAYGAPAGRYGSFVLDMACTAAAVERIVRAKEQGETIPAGWALDIDGNETNDPAKALESLALLPFGGYKAFGLAMVHEMVTSVIAGGALFAGDSKGFAPYDEPMNTSFSLLAIDIAAFQPLAEFEATMERMIDTVKASRPRAGGQILFPGERSQAELCRRQVEGIPVASATLDMLNEWGRELGVGVLCEVDRTTSRVPEGPGTHVKDIV
jgi:LDH2 family malate/lactate/ureidoglycolate dehydrogenase